MVGVKDFTKGFYKEFILMWFEINKENKFLSLNEIRTRLKDNFKKDYIQPKIYKTLIFMKENNLSNYDNLKWCLNYPMIKKYYQNKFNESEKRKLKLDNELTKLNEIIKEL